MVASVDSAAEMPFLEFDLQSRKTVRFSYSRPEDPLLRKALINTVESLSGRRFLRRRYLEWASHGNRNETIFAAGVRTLGISLAYDAEAFAAIPREGPLLVVANHPFGVADGLALGDLITRARPDARILTHSLLCQPPEAERYLLPVDFGGTRAAKARSAQTRLAAVQWLKDGHCLILFPSGGVATRQKPLAGPALDLPWHPFVAKLAAVRDAKVLPLFIHGQNSTLFHLASHSLYLLRVALLFRETRRQRGRTMEVKIGPAQLGQNLPFGEGKMAVADALRAMTFALDDSGKSSAVPYKWPRHVRF